MDESNDRAYWSPKRCDWAHALIAMNAILVFFIFFDSMFLYFFSLYLPSLMMYYYYPFLACVGCYFAATLHPRNDIMKILQLVFAILSFFALSFYLNEAMANNSISNKYDGEYQYSQVSRVDNNTLGTFTVVTSSYRNYPWNSWPPIFVMDIVVCFVCILFCFVHVFIVLYSWYQLKDTDAREWTNSKRPVEFEISMQFRKGSTDSLRWTASFLALLVFMLTFVFSVISFVLLNYGFIPWNPFPNLLALSIVAMPMAIYPPSGLKGVVAVENFDKILVDEKNARLEYGLQDKRQYGFLFLLAAATLFGVINLIFLAVWRIDNNLPTVGACNSAEFQDALAAQQTLHYFSTAFEQNVTWIPNSDNFDYSLWTMFICLDDWFNLIVVMITGIIFFLSIGVFARKPAKVDSTVTPAMENT